MFPEHSLKSPRLFAKRYARGNRIFLGFEDALLDDLLGGFDARLQAAPQISTVEGAHLIPLKRLGKGHFVGGVLGAGDYLTALSLYRGYGCDRVAHVFKPEDVSHMRESGDRLPCAWFGGYLFDHYGHFLLEGLARVLSPEIINSTEPIIFHNPTRFARLPSYMGEVFSRIGIDAARIRLCDNPLRVDELRVQEPSFEIRGFVRPAAYSQLKKGDVAPHSSRMVYISRSKLRRRRLIEGESELEQWLSLRLAADVIWPETLSFETQLSRYAGAGCILGCEGSAFHTLMFLRQISSAVIFCHELPSITYLLCDELFDGDTTYVQASQTGEETRNRDQWRLDIQVAKDVALSCINS